jgi:2-polyprenyl-3-methyl-5-hydroxy-6-metoxy-1,4-benzoquinol methylase
VSNETGYLKDVRRLLHHAYSQVRGRYRLRHGGPAAFANGFWYYTVELAPSVTAQGQYESHFPMLPRMMMRRCNLAGADCLDLGSMEGLVPVLMRRAGARRVLATDFGPHCVEKILAVKAAYKVDFDYKSVGPMDGLYRKIRGGFDLINCSGLLYHVWSPLHVLAGVRPLLRRNGLMIVNTNVVLSDGMLAEFNAAGHMQDEANTFWYPTVELLQYQLRYLRLQPIDAMAVSHEALRSKIRYKFDTPSSILCILCRATDEVAADPWMRESVAKSWEYRSFTDWARADRQPESPITAENMNPIELTPGEMALRQVPGTVCEQDAHILHLADRS